MYHPNASLLSYVCHTLSLQKFYHHHRPDGGLGFKRNQKWGERENEIVGREIVGIKYALNANAAEGVAGGDEVTEEVVDSSGGLIRSGASASEGNGYIQTNHKIPRGKLGSERSRPGRW
ncbi:hypothetical protein F0562_035048 [Nyssa sinensis]|uniref:Uncharacterized protein n=1 Tax=Nyssa sinensis TaxID=561372 RepID=A0A5J5ACR7_9ASTE|nr:hypothetical protein F0562_035048 [Nyssa sinensis]